MKQVKQKSLKSIVAKSFSGDVEAQRTLIKRFNGRLWKLSYQIDNENAEDTYQDLLLFLFEILSKVSLDNFSEGGLVNYINISLNHEMAHIRSRIYSKVVNETAITEDQFVPESKYHTIETHLFLKAIKSYLTKEEWELLVEIYELKIPVKKISKKHHISVQAVYQKKKSIQQKIQMKFGKDYKR